MGSWHVKELLLKNPNSSLETQLAGIGCFVAIQEAV